MPVDLGYRSVFMNIFLRLFAFDYLQGVWRNSSSHMRKQCQRASLS